MLPTCQREYFKNIEFSTMLRRYSKTIVIISLFLILFSNLCTAKTRQEVEQWLNETAGLSAEELQYRQYFKLVDCCYGKYQFEDSIKNCEEALKIKKDSYILKAAICLNLYEIGEDLNVKVGAEREKKLATYKKLISVAEEGIKLNPDKGECYFMRGLGYARLSTTEGVISSLFNAKRTELDWLEAIKHDSDYITPSGEDLQASSYLALGVYYRICPSFFLISLIFGISGDLDKSVEYCDKAYQMDPTRIEIVKEYGISLITRGLDRNKPEDIEKGKVFLKKVETLPLRMKTDAVDKEHSKMLLNDINLCPGYSRDQQQEISEQAFKTK